MLDGICYMNENSVLVKRVDLHSLLPLDVPLSVHVYPSYKCNFRCNYCIHAFSTEEMKQKGFSREKMNMDTFLNIVDGLKEYEEKVKAVIFAGHGEPLTHENIADMVRLLKEAEVAERVEITTNGSLLTKDMSDKLISSGVDRLKVSIQGTTADKYKSIAKYNIDYDSFLEKLTYFYDNKESTEVYIKIIDAVLEGEGDEKKFRRMFEPVSDYVDVEYLIPFINGIDHLSLKESFDKCKQGHAIASDICSMPFYMQVVAPNGDILPCCSVDVPTVIANVNEVSLIDAWHSHAMLQFQRCMLRDKSENLVCKGCSVPSYGLQVGDYLDNHRERLANLYSELNERSE